MSTDEKLHEECAAFAVSTHSDEAAGITYNGLLSLQHRGQEGSGLAVLSALSLHCYKDVGLVSEAFSSGTPAGYGLCKRLLYRPQLTLPGSPEKTACLFM